MAPNQRLSSRAVRGPLRLRLRLPRLRRLRHHRRLRAVYTRKPAARRVGYAGRPHAVVAPVVARAALLPVLERISHLAALAAHEWPRFE